MPCPRGGAREKFSLRALDRTPVHASHPSDQTLQHTPTQPVGPHTVRFTLGARGLVSLASHKLCFTVLARSAMVSSSLGRLAASQAVGAGGWSYAQIVERLSPAVSKFAVGRAELASEGARKRPAGPSQLPATPRRQLAAPPPCCQLNKPRGFTCSTRTAAGGGGRPRQRILRVDHRRAQAPGHGLRHRWVLSWHLPCRALCLALPTLRFVAHGCPTATALLFLACRRGEHGALPPAGGGGHSKAGGADHHGPTKHLPGQQAHGECEVWWGSLRGRVGHGRQRLPRLHRSCRQAALALRWCTAGCTCPAVMHCCSRTAAPAPVDWLACSRRRLKANTACLPARLPAG